MLALGVRHIPVVARGTDYVMGQSIADVAKFVGIENFTQLKLPPDVLMQKWLTVLGAAQRHIRQYPAERLAEQLYQGRDQTIGHMGYHVFRIGHAFLETAERGVADWVTVSIEAPPDSLRTGYDIASYGESVKSRLSEWWNAHPDKTCSEMVYPFTGPQPLRDFLERQTWHSAQHTRQLAAVLERYGIKADKPLTAEELAGLPLPSGLWV